MTPARSSPRRCSSTARAEADDQRPRRPGPATARGLGAPGSARRASSPSSDWLFGSVGRPHPAGLPQRRGSSSREPTGRPRRPTSAVDAEGAGRDRGRAPPPGERQVDEEQARRHLDRRRQADARPRPTGGRGAARRRRPAPARRSPGRSAPSRASPGPAPARATTGTATPSATHRGHPCRSATGVTSHHVVRTTSTPDTAVRRTVAVVSVPSGERQQDQHGERRVGEALLRVRPQEVVVQEIGLIRPAVRPVSVNPASSSPSPNARRPARRPSDQRRPRRGRPTRRSSGRRVGQPGQPAQERLVGRSCRRGPPAAVSHRVGVQYSSEDRRVESGRPSSVARSERRRRRRPRPGRHRRVSAK